MKKKKVLLVDDSRFWRVILENTVKPYCSEVYVAEDAMKAIEMALKYFPDVIITDYTMPGPSGLQLCLYLRSIPAFKDAGIAVLTGSDDVINEFWALHSGATTFISKLLPREVLESELLAFLQGDYQAYPESGEQIRSVFDVLEQKLRTEVLNREILSLVQYAHDEAYVINELQRFISFFTEGRALAFLLLSPVEGRVYNYGFQLQKQFLKQAIISYLDKPIEPSAWLFVGDYGTDTMTHYRICVHVVSYMNVEVGAIGFQSSEISWSLQSVLTDASESLGLLFNTLNSFRELKVASSVDNLTGLLNKKELFKMLEELHDTSILQEKPYYVAMIDIDNFKKINDTYGHLFGDEVLRGVANVIRNSLPSGAAAARYGGEEFTIVFRECTKENVLSTVEKILNEVRKLNIGGITCTVSIGVCDSVSYRSHTEVLKAADDLLYLAKKEGKNRATVHFSKENLSVYVGT